MAAPELPGVEDFGRQHQVEVRGVDIAVGDHGVSGQGGEGGGQAGLAGPPLAADHNQFFHDTPGADPPQGGGAAVRFWILEMTEEQSRSKDSLSSGTASTISLPRE